ncbi:hypothetical protein Q7P37_010929 [Cladosporium fusiforme]
MYFSRIAESLVLFACTANAFNLYFYSGSQCNGGQTGDLQDITNVNVCSTEGLSEGQVESVLVQSDGVELPEVVFYDDESCNGQEVFRTRNGGCVDIVGFGVKSFALRDRD